MEIEASTDSRGNGQRFALTALFYVVSFVILDWISFIHPFAPFGLKPWDPPTALTLALLIRLGLGYAVVVPVAVLLADILVRGMPVASLSTLLSGSAITAVHVSAAWILREILVVDPRLSRLADVVRLVSVSLAATSALATSVVLEFTAAGLLDPVDFASAAVRSWVGDFIGILAITPALLVFSDRATVVGLIHALRNRPTRILEAVLQGGMILLTVWLVFELKADEFKFFYLLFLPNIGIAVRHGLEGASASLLLTQVGLIAALTIQGYGATEVVEFQMLMLALCLTGLFLGAIVSERSHANRALAENQARLQAILDTAPDAILTVDESGAIETANPAVERMFGGQGLGQGRRGRIAQKLTDLLPGLKLDAEGIHEMHGVRRDGTTFPVEVTVGETAIASQRRFIAIARDVTRRVEAEAWVHQHQLQLAHADRVSLVGEMASAIAHEESQPLSAIAAYTRACLLLLKAPVVDLDKVNVSLNKVARQAARAGEILRRLREFLQRGEMQPEAIAVADLVTAVAELARADAQDHGIRLELDVAPDLPLVLADRVHIEQVLLNLVRNAVDALSGQPREQCQRAILIRARERNSRVVLTVHDNGPGIDPAIAERLFHPFTSTKTSGMGLGLTISRTIIEAHGGTLVHELTGRPGTTFSFDLAFADE